MRALPSWYACWITLTGSLDTGKHKLQALVYDIIPPVTAIAEHAIGLEKLSANERFSDDAQTVGMRVG